MDPDWLIDWLIDRSIYSSVWSTRGSVSFTISQWLYCSRINSVTVDAKCHTLKANASLDTFPPFSLVCTVPSKGKGEGGTNYRDAGLDCVEYVFVFRNNIICNDVEILSCWLYFRPAAVLRRTLSSLFPCFSPCPSTLAVGPEKGFHRGLNPLSAALGVYLGMCLCACALMSQDYQEMSGKVCCDGACIFQMRSLFFLYMSLTLMLIIFSFILYRCKRESLAYCIYTAQS